MARRALQRTGAVAALLCVCGGACGGEPAPSTPVKSAAAPEAKPAPRPDDESVPASQRILGKWSMSIDEVPDGALTDDFRQIKAKGLGKKMRVEYTFTEDQFTLDSWGETLRSRKRWHYEILKEVGNELMLRRLSDDGEVHEIAAVLTGGRLIIGTGTGQIPLTRIEE